MNVSKAFALFMQETPASVKAWTQAAEALDVANTLEKKTETLGHGGFGKYART